MGEGTNSMTTEQKPKWESMRTPESRTVEDVLLKAGFECVDAYRYNSASLRVRIVDKRFNSLSRDERDTIVEPYIARLSESTQSDIINLVLLSPSEFDNPSDSFRGFLPSVEFEDPSPSML